VRESGGPLVGFRDEAPAGALGSRAHWEADTLNLGQYE